MTTLATAPAVTQGTWFTDDDRRAALRIDEDTFAALQEAGPLLRANVDRIVTEFYDAHRERGVAQRR